MKRNIRDWKRTCSACQINKVHRHVRSTPPTPSSRFETVHIDIVGPLPLSRNQRYLFTCIDRFRRWVETIPMEDCTAETTWRAFMSGWVSRFGAPNTVITDQGVQFESTLWRNQLSALGSKRSRTTAYHPQSNGLLERVHRRLKEGIKTQPEPYNLIDTFRTLLCISTPLLRRILMYLQRNTCLAKNFDCLDSFRKTAAYLARGKPCWRC